jgi:(E)-4-hydroxy-3-methylbut-2-enyl-diphosphate synthase
MIARYGNTIEGMVEAVIEFLEVFIYERFFNVVVSMKSSDLYSMVYASRYLNARMIEMSNVFPMHLGVTEAGSGLAGRMKSVIGIGSLLGDGIGDTIRVSLSEPPENEIVVANKIVSEFSSKIFKYQNISQHFPTYNPCVKKKKKKKNPLFENKFITVSSDLTVTADLYYLPTQPEHLDPHKKYLAHYKLWKAMNYPINVSPMLYFADTQTLKIQNDVNYFVLLERSELYKAETLTLFKLKNIFPIINCDVDGAIGVLRCFYSKIGRTHSIPLIIKTTILNFSPDDILPKLSDFIGSALTDDLCSGLWLDIMKCNPTVYDDIMKELLQTMNIRKYRAEFISCPTCGRTTYNLEKIAQAVKREFAHLTHLKIAIMGCIVNGPGEMNDADYGCVGFKPGTVNIYKGKEVVLKDVPEKNAVKKLKEVINKATNKQ